MVEYYDPSYRRVGIKDLLIATAVIGCVLAIAVPASRLAADPSWLVATLPPSMLFVILILCLPGVVPTAILAMGYLVLKELDSPLKLFYALLTMFLAVGSIPIVKAIGSACFNAVV